MGNIYEEVKNKFKEAAESMKLGYGLDTETELGPMTTQAGKEKVMRWIEKSLSEGAKMVRFVLNGRPIEVEVPPHWTLLRLLREKLGLTGTKEGCGIGECGACTVLLDGMPVNACLVLVPKIEGRKIETIEGLGSRESLHPLQKSFIDHGAVQCGFCTPGILMSSKSLLEKNPHPNREEVKEAISGHLCRCTGYQQIIEAIEEVSEV